MAQCPQPPWRCRPLTSFETLLQSIARATTANGPTPAEWEDAPDPTGIVVRGKRLQALHVTRDPLHGEWSCHITP